MNDPRIIITNIHRDIFRQLSAAKEAEIEEKLK